MNPIVSWRSAAYWLSVSVAVSLPAILTLPLVGRSRPPMMLSRVDFPLPLGPIRQTNSPGMTVSSAAMSALTTSSPSLCSFQTSAISMTGVCPRAGTSAVVSDDSSSVVTGQSPASERMGGREAAFHVGIALVPSAATTLTASAIAVPTARPP